MSFRLNRRVPLYLSLFATIGFAAVGLWFGFGNLDVARALGRIGDYAPLFVFVPVAISIELVGITVSIKVPGNRLGPVFTGIGLAMAAGSAAYFVAVDVFNSGGTPASGWRILAITGPLLTFGSMLVLIASLIAFPDGKLLSRRWGWGLGVFVFGGAVALLSQAYSPDAFNPLLEEPGLLKSSWMSASTVQVLRIVGPLILMAGFLVTAGSLAQRYRVGSAEQREQLKWVALAGFFLLGVLLLDGGIPGDQTIINVLDAVGLMLIPLAAGVAITRYRLYDIDILISRTLVYGPLTALLAGTYTGAIIFFRLIFVDVLRVDSDAAIATTTLAIAALFVPMKNRVQSIVDRWFKDDEQKRLEAFGSEMAKLAESFDANALVGRFTRQVAAMVGRDVRVLHNDGSLWAEAAAGDVSNEVGEPQETLAILKAGNQELGSVVASFRANRPLRQAHAESISRAADNLAVVLVARGAGR